MTIKKIVKRILKKSQGLLLPDCLPKQKDDKVNKSRDYLLLCLSEQIHDGSGGDKKKQLFLSWLIVINKNSAITIDEKQLLACCYQLNSMIA